jgi:hypothetical protein
VSRSAGRLTPTMDDRTYFLQACSFSSARKKTNQKKAPVSRGASHSPARRRCDRSTRKLTLLSAGFRQVRVLSSGRIDDARHETKGNLNPKPQKPFSSPLQGGFLRPPATRESRSSVTPAGGGRPGSWDVTSVVDVWILRSSRRMTRRSPINASPTYLPLF